MVVLDCLVVTVSWVLVGLWLIRDGNLAASLTIVVAGTITTLAATVMLDPDRSKAGARRTDDLGQVALAVFAGAAVFEFAQWQLEGSGGAQAIVCGGLCLVLLSGVRSHNRRWLRNCHERGRYRQRVVLLGTNDDATGLVKMLTAEPELGYEITSIVGRNGSVAPLGPGLFCSSSIGDLPELARESGADGVLIVANALSGAEMHDAITVASGAGLRLHIWPGISGVDGRRLRPVPMSGDLFFDVQPQVVRRWEIVAKRIVDLVGSIIGLALAAPLLACAAVLVKLTDHGPVFHRQERIGKNGKPFTVYKLRTMTSDQSSVAFDRATLNERTDGPLFKSSRDPRVTPVGRYLRASSIDELPQLWNVLSGSMSLVGPRPALPEETAQFDQDLLRRLTVRPGLTGLWQVEARNNPSFDAYRRLDLHYVDNWSFTLDLRILSSTFPVVLSQGLRAVRERRSTHAFQSRRTRRSVSGPVPSPEMVPDA